MYQTTTFEIFFSSCRNPARIHYIVIEETRIRYALGFLYVRLVWLVSELSEKISQTWWPNVDSSVFEKDYEAQR